MRVCARLRDLSVLASLILGLVGPAPRANAEDPFVLNRPLPKLESLLPRTPRQAVPTQDAKGAQVSPAFRGDPFVLNRPLPKLESLVASAPRHGMVQAPAVTAADPICDIFANGYDVTGAAPCATCFDGVTDHDETDADCGGAWCKACADSKQCLVNSDCISTLCNPGPHTCSPATCLDGSKDGGETDVDCGGGACPVCAVGMQCIQSTDCTSRVCAFGICQAPACNDGVKNGAETDVDCGGGICPVCALGLQCNTDADCASNACDALTNLCVANQCADHRKDGQESDADCGGGICPACTPGLQCNQNSDCGSNNCSGGMCLCNTDVDCASNACDALTNLCVANQCADHRKDGQETDVDCGGGVCALCATGNQCVIGSDCVSGICSGNTCQ